MSSILILGAGGHGKVVADCLCELGGYDRIAFLDDGRVGQAVLGFPVLGTLKELTALRGDFQRGFVAIGNNRLRVSMLERLLAANYDVPSLIHPLACVSKAAQIGMGTLVVAGAVVNADSIVGQGVIINTLASVDHDCRIASGVHVAPGAHIGGSVIIGVCSWIGLGASVINDVTIGSYSVVAAGAAVVCDVADSVMVAGVPARIKKTLAF